ncbi:hypothetical protein NicSoilC12_32280 [Arthrobacter sp. NicSoilC12]|nr:hypothetical protein NicSoilC12_32280 [Arthrobacter sp. NicSoilC12]
MNSIWLKSMQNGVLGEARAKSFLVERFWVLERSVDVQGADLLIQRKLTARNFLDYSPPPVGVVQAKFIQDGKTNISIPRSYVQDRNGDAYDEFFLLVFTGFEDNERMFFLTAADVKQHFDEAVDKEKLLFRIRGRDLLSLADKEVQSKRRSLNEIEHALSNADFRRNRRFLGNSGHLTVDRSNIDVAYTVPFANWYGNIIEAFYEQKSNAKGVLDDLERCGDALRAMISATDPIEAMHTYEKELHEFIDGRGYLAFSMDKVWNEDLYDSARAHTRHLDRLSEMGIRSGYEALMTAFDHAIQDYANKPPSASVVSTHITVTYNPRDLGKAEVEILEEDRLCAGAPSPNQWARIVESKAGRQIICYDEGRIHAAPAGYAPAITPEIYILPFQRALDTVIFGEESDLY